jgi:predicted SprT family Zn-dependent metalloprotease
MARAAAATKKAAPKGAAPGRKRSKKPAAVSYGTEPEASITSTEYSAIQNAYDFFNQELFAYKLPQVLVTLQRTSAAYGYFSPERFTSRTNAGAAHELALNPDHFGRTEEEVLGTLAHEMCHVWQQTHGTPPRRCYHDREWAAQMKAIGLHPSDTAAPGGKETGQAVSHYIVPGGPFHASAVMLKRAGFRIHWTSRTDEPAAKKKAASKTKYTCAECGQNAWAKPGAKLVCGNCHADEDAETMEAEA